MGPRCSRITENYGLLEKVESFLFAFVRTGHLQHILNPPLYENYCTGMYSIGIQHHQKISISDLI
jgi:hypothetical protein